VENFPEDTMNFPENDNNPADSFAVFRQTEDLGNLA